MPRKKAATKKAPRKKAASKTAPSPSAPKSPSTSSPSTSKPSQASAPAAKASSKSSITPSYAQIAERAYHIWLQNGRPVGQDETNWFKAVAQLEKELN